MRAMSIDPQAPPISADPPPGSPPAAATARAGRRQARLVRSRTLTLFGGLVLCWAFFLPAVDSCGRAVYPAAELVDDVTNWDGKNPLDFAGMFSMYASPYVFGLLVAMGALFSLCGRSIVGTWFDRLALSVIGFACTTGLIAFGLELHNNGMTLTFPMDWPVVIFFTAMLFGLISLLTALRKGEAGRVSGRWTGALLGLVWFGLWLYGGGTYFGLWLSILGAALIAAGALGEAMAMARLGPWATMLRLAPCRIQFRPIDDNRCDRCGYLLIGLPTRRCPECGEPF
jgi:hypothetical protein